MKHITLQSGFLGALSGLFGAMVACTLGVLAMLSFLVLRSSATIGDDWILILTDNVFGSFGFSYVWLPGAIMGSLVGFISGEWVISRPHLLDRMYIWAFVGSLTSVGTLLIIGGTHRLASEFTLVIAMISGLIGGVVARFVYGMLQRRFLPELQMN